MAVGPPASDTLHPTRVTRDRRQVRTPARLCDLPDGTFVSLPDEPGAAWLVWNEHLHRWSHEGYTETTRLAPREVIVLTPEPTIGVFDAGYQPVVHFAAM